MPTITWSALPRCSAFLLALAVGCAATPEPAKTVQQEKLAALPATFANTPGCEGCLSLTLTLRPDGAYLVRERVGGSEFYDFGRWRQGADGLLLEGGRDAPRHYTVKAADTLDSLAGTQGGDLKRLPQVEALRGPFRVVGTYDGVAFRECRTGLAWPLGESRPAERLKEDLAGRKVGLVAIDGRLETQGGREEIGRAHV